MKFFYTSAKQLALGGVLFVLVFSITSHWYVGQSSIEDVRQFNTHAQIITHDLWALNGFGIRSYLQLAVQANHYKHLAVLLEDGSLFYEENCPHLSGSDALLHSLGLLPLKRLSTEITFHDMQIGTLQGQQYIRVIYPLINIFLFLLLLMVASLFVLNLMHYRKLLELEVLERTKKYRDSQRRFHDLVNLLPEMVCETDCSGNFTYANEITSKRFALSNGTIHANIVDCIVPDQRKRYRENLSAVVQGRGQKLEEFTACSGRNKTFPILIRSAPIYTGADVKGVRSVIVDITERCTLEERLRRAQRMEVIGMMAGGVAHDLNNILSAMVNYPEVMLMKLPADSELRRHVKAMKKSGLQAAEVVADLLTVSRGIAAAKVVDNLNILVGDYLESPEFLQLRSLHPKIFWKSELDEATANIICSPIHVKKCIMNLVTNAAEAIPDSGSVVIKTVTLQVDHPLEQEISIPAGRYSILQVSDSGSGIADQDLEHIFEPFYTKKTMGRSGTGLGLAVVWNTIQDHDGGIRVTSNERGTAIALYFPTTEQQVEPESPETDLTDVMGNGEKILVIDDDQQQQDIALQLLTSLNYQATAVSSGEEAFEYLRTRFVHLLLLDMLMPPGINGLQTYKLIRAIHPKQKAVVTSGFSESELVRKTLDLGASSFIKKPYTMEQLARVIFHALH